MDAFEKFDRWVSWLGKDRDAAKRIRCHPSQVRRIRRRERRPLIEYAVRIQRESADWPEGPIRVEEWAEVRSERRKKTGTDG